MLIEASKGGHAQVVKLLLDWTGSSNSSPSDELSQSSLSQSSLDLQQVSRSTLFASLALFASCAHCSVEGHSELSGPSAVLQHLLSQTVLGFGSRDFLFSAYYILRNFLLLD